MTRLQQLTLLALTLAVTLPSLSAQAVVGSRAPVVTVMDLDGKAVELPVAGRPTMIEFWATWCEVCEQLLPRVAAARKSFGDRVEFIGVNVTVNESKSRVTRWVNEHRPPYRTLWDDRGVAVRAYGALVTSYVIIVDSAGIIRYTGSGGDQDLAGALAKVARR